MGSLWLFVVVFIAGPLAFVVLVKQARKLAELRIMVVLVIALMSIGLVAGRMARQPDGLDQFMAITSVVSFWCAWIALIAVLVAMIQRHYPHRTTKRIANATGAMATTLPWMGLYLARWIAG
jgi:lysylphosphatidylglycerol synthetase-like protein (DUF2156 family)